jgi:uridylate kinase
MIPIPAAQFWYFSSEFSREKVLICAAGIAPFFTTTFLPQL